MLINFGQDFKSKAPFDGKCAQIVLAWAW
jgi:hypothetical protein